MSHLPGDGSQDNKRLAERTSTLKRAQITFGSSSIDCVVVDSSVGGMRARTASIMPVPEWVNLKFADGSLFRARKCWARGTQIGFELAVDGGELLDAMIAGLTLNQRRALIAKLEASLRNGWSGARSG